MIPWFVVSLIELIVYPFGYDVNVLVTSGNRWRVERVSLVKRPSGTKRLQRIGPCRGGPVHLADAAPANDCRDLTRADPWATSRTDLGPSGPLSHRG